MKICPVCEQEMSEVKTVYGKNGYYTVERCDKKYYNCYYIKHVNGILIEEAFRLINDKQIYYFSNVDSLNVTRVTICPEVLENTSSSIERDSIFLNIRKVSFLEEPNLNKDKLIKKIKNLMIIA